jgi:predicted unusual protein kinase regulating ubiquinone biosynthesis (AarF/ABC1/UbiB family)
MGRVLLEFVQISGRCGLRLPPELATLAKTLLNLDHVGRILDPAFDPNASIRRNASELMQHRLLSNVTLGSVLSSVLETRTLVANMPARINRILETIANNELELKVDAIDETKLIQGLQKIANRITVGLVLAALIIGAALLMRVETRFTLFGYPGLAMLLFLAAAAGGVGLMINIWFSDEKPHRTP